MSQDFEKLSLKELFTNVDAFLAFSLVTLIGLSAILVLMILDG